MANMVKVVAAWQEHFEYDGVQGRLIDKLTPAFRDLADIASPELRAELAGIAG